MDITTNNVAAVVAILTAAGGCIGTWLKIVDGRQEEKISELKDHVGKLELTIDARASGLKTDYSTRAKDVEITIAEIEKTYISRAEHAEFRAEMMNTTREIGDKVSRSIDNLGQKVE